MEKLFNSKKTSDLTDEERDIEIVRLANLAKGDIEGFHCDKCNNKGEIHYVNRTERCSCMNVRYADKQLKDIGVDTSKTFDNFKVSNQYQKDLYDSARDFVKNDQSLFVGGQVGSGKTHACGAALIALIKLGHQCKYMKWKQDVIDLKRNKMDESYSKRINEIKNVEILYIDDLFKTTRGSMPTSADADLAYEIIDYRNSKSLKTIISCELYIQEIEEIDEAIASRITEMSVLLHVKRDKQRDNRK